MYFHKKNYTTIIRKYWATKYENKRENKFGRLVAVCLMHVDISSFKRFTGPLSIFVSFLVPINKNIHGTKF